MDVLRRSLERGRVGHAMLFQGEDSAALAAVAEALAAKFLGLFDPPAETEGADLFGDAPPPPPPPADGAAVAAALARHPDYFVLRPVGRMRVIGAEAVRELLRSVSQTPNRADRKVAVLHDADRLNKTAQNILLKTLEEPPADTHLLLLTTRPYALLDTIRSRALHFRLPAVGGGATDPGWAAWLDDYAQWLRAARGGPPRGDALASAVLGGYGLALRFQTLLDEQVEKSFRALRENPPPGQTAELLEAAEVGLARELRRHRLQDVERKTRDVAAELGASPLLLTHAVADLEHVAGLLEANLREEVALEYFLLRLLRHGARF